MASALENYVTNVRKLSSAEKYRELADYLNDTVELLTKNWSILDNVLETLDSQEHSLGVLYVVIAKFNSVSQNSNVDASTLVLLFKDFVTECNVTQVRYAVHAFYDLCHQFTNFVVDKQFCLQGVQYLAKAIKKIRMSETQLTPVHADLCQLSLKAKSMTCAVTFLDIDIATISTGLETRASTATDTNLDSKYFLLYYYYGGMIYTAIKRYERALYFFEVCISTPALAMSHIMLEAYKKFILVSLIVNGCLLQIPKYATQVVGRYLKPLSPAYHELVVAYGTTYMDEFRSVISKSSETFVRDKNMGLVQQVAESLYKQNIKRLTKTFLTVSLTDIANRVQLPSAAEAEKFLVKMISAGEIFALIDQKEGMVEFREDSEKYNSEDMFLKIQQDIAHTNRLLNKITEMEEEIELNPLYLKKFITIQDDDSQPAKPFSSDPTD
ncbi:COP9 signalosome complex subunit 3-like [Teleopsis dalmanni]|uniref:COP9 signalosome complex subunit 3-like n=1 Tax=Teleopsis dalmanni TaxID=139649 RepID=UPI0018CDA617|nr:COP9 signalosome complex subunit 3-like [Teleopsis dalmanni]XP_037939637.1 COP9 signalosome complex subunit 3-like [Teleopsis dalmanni]